MIHPTIFISHCWIDKPTAENIYNVFKSIGIKVKMDNHELKYKDSLESFMNSIRDCDYAILLVSDSYLKSINCLYEVMQLSKEKLFEEKVLPIILESAKIYDLSNKIKYVTYWQEKKVELEEQLKPLDPLNAIDSLNALRRISDISQSIDRFLGKVSDMLNISLEDLKKVNYLPILEKIGYLNFEFAVQLLQISSIDNLDDKETALDNYLTAYDANTYYYAIRGATYAKQGKFKQAKFNYEQSIKLDPSNYEALNNLGQIISNVYKEYDVAKEYYVRAIESNPTDATARLNLGVLLGGHFANIEEAKLQYEAILKFNPQEVRAHNNLANYFRATKQLDLAEYHLRRAIEIAPNYFEAYLNLGNLLKTSGKKVEGNEIYNLAKKIAPNADAVMILDTLLTLDNG